MKVVCLFVCHVKTWDLRNHASSLVALLVPLKSPSILMSTSAPCWFHNVPTYDEEVIVILFLFFIENLFKLKFVAEFTTFFHWNFI